VKLTVFHNDEQVAEYQVDDESTKSSQFDNVIYVGRSDECHVVIDDKQISRQHLKISKSSGDWEFERVTELGQVLHNGSITTKAKLKNGDMLQFSGYMLNVFLPVFHVEKQTFQEPVAVDSKPIVKNTNSIQDLDDFSTVKGLAPKSNDFLDEDFSTQVMPEPKTKVAPQSKVAVKHEVKDDISPETSGDEDSGDSFLSETSESQSDDQQMTDSNDDFLSSHNEHSHEDSNQTETNDFNSDSSTNGSDDGELSSQTTEANYPVETSGDEGGGSSEGTVVFSGFATYELHLLGEAAPYDRFVINDNETFIGRNKDKCQIFLDDQEVSGVHAVIKRTKISCTLEDLNSSNGTLVNGQRINSIDLLNGDEFVIGSTTFSVHVKSDLIQQEFGRLMPVEEDQEITKEEIVEEEVEFEAGADGAPIDFSDGAITAPKSKSLFDLKDPAKRKKLLYIVVGLVLMYVFLGEEEAPQPTKDPKANQAKENSNLLNKDVKPTPDPKAAEKKVIDPEKLKEISFLYEKAKAHNDIGEYDQAIIELKRYYDVYPDYKSTRMLMDKAKLGVAKLAEADRKIKEEAERKERKMQVEAILTKAKEAVKERQTQVAEALFGQILEKDPENLDVPQLKMELDAWKKEQEKIALEKAQKEAERKRQLNLLQPGKTAYLKKDWNVAIGKLEDFLRNKDMDEDLIKEASAMLTESKNNLNDIIAPLLGQARSLKEGQDLKGAYQIYSEILRKEPSNSEAITEMGDIRNILDDRAKKIYREALISENLSLFEEAKEKFQEVQQNTPTDSEYYKKASEKLRNYVE
jgi:pSer/pThr/pTyr-binding forkhead associated (FHA) protein/tetratricopeptide (TPR) repeat protein